MPKKGPLANNLGSYGIAQSNVLTPGYAGLLDPMTGEPMEGGGGGGGFSMGFGGGEYRGRIGADTSSLPPSQRGLYENSAPSLESIQGAYDANMATGRYTHEEIMANFNAQADRDAKFWADGFAKDADFSNNLQRQSQAMLGTNQAAKQLLYDRGTKKNRYGQTVNDQLRASAGVFDAPRQGAMPGGRSSAPMADPNTAAIAAMRQSRQNKSAIAKAPKASKGFTRQSAQYSRFGSGR